jgi:hypothetical protein
MINIDLNARAFPGMQCLALKWNMIFFTGAIGFCPENVKTLDFLFVATCASSMSIIRAG